MRRKPLLPGSTIGVVGGGQLGRMFVLVARRMGYRTMVLDPDPHSPAAQISDHSIGAPLDDVDAARELGTGSDVVTLEWENVDLGLLRALRELVEVRPGAQVLEVAQNRLLEKQTARRLGLNTAEFRRVDSLQSLTAACAELGTPAVLKTTKGGYDGRGQVVLRRAEEASGAFSALGAGAVELILESWVPYRLEASVICARSTVGEIASFPVVQNIHKDGILDFTLAPADLPPAVQREAVGIGEALAEGLGLVGILAVELFIDESDRVLVNEIAPRPHNSGHYTWEACSVSQFEQQLRAVCGLPLAEPVLLRPAAMANLLGQHIGTGAGLEALGEALGVPMLSLHLYGKGEARPGRKMGHLTVLADDATTAYRNAEAARARIELEYVSMISRGAAADTTG